MPHPTQPGELTLAGLRAYARTVVPSESALDDEVHEVAAGLARDANNGGIDDQVAFLRRHLGARITREVLERYTDADHPAPPAPADVTVTLTADDVRDLADGHTITTLTTSGVEVTVAGGDLDDTNVQALRHGEPVTAEVGVGSRWLNAELSAEQVTP